VWLAVPWVCIGLALLLDGVRGRQRSVLATMVVLALAVPAQRQITSLAGRAPVASLAKAASNRDVLVTSFGVERPVADVVATTDEARFFLVTGRLSVPALPVPLGPDELVRRYCEARVGLIAVPDSDSRAGDAARLLARARPETLKPLYALTHGPSLYRFQCPG
jgi:hypothetical protein